MNAANTKTANVEHRHHTTSSTYRSDSFKLLKKDFRMLSVEAIKKTWEFHQYNFSNTVQVLRAIEDNQQENDVAERFPCLQGVQKIRIKHPRVEKPLTIRDPTLKAELKSFQQLIEKSAHPGLPSAQVDQEDAKIISIASNDTETEDVLVLECACCFGDYPFHEMVQCTEAHLFCTDCLQHHVHEQIHERNSTFFACMDSSGRELCGGFFDRMQLDKLPTQLQELVDKKVALQNIKKAGIGSECPKCPSIGFVEDPAVIIVQCLECLHQYCRLCSEDGAIHDGKSCEQVAQENQENRVANAVHDINEAMSAAVIRKCPVCARGFIKVGGCNKITCPNDSCPVPGSITSTQFCYLCRQKIDGYEHFCRAPHCNHASCGKCVLYTDSEKDDRIARQEAARAEMSKLDNSDVEAVKAVAGLLTPDKDPTHGRALTHAPAAPAVAPVRPPEGPRRPHIMVDNADDIHNHILMPLEQVRAGQQPLPFHAAAQEAQEELDRNVIQGRQYAKADIRYQRAERRRQAIDEHRRQMIDEHRVRQQLFREPPFQRDNHAAPAVLRHRNANGDVQNQNLMQRGQNGMRQVAQPPQPEFFRAVPPPPLERPANLVRQYVDANPDVHHPDAMQLGQHPVDFPLQQPELEDAIAGHQNVPQIGAVVAMEPQQNAEPQRNEIA